MMQAQGTFDVNLSPAAPDERPDTQFLARMLIDKTFHGPLNATSKGQMLAAQSPLKGSAGYVAIERVTGNLDGKTGSFLLAHMGLASQIGQTLTVSVIPDSGTDQLTGLTGTMSILNEEGKHTYIFDYSLQQ